MLTYETKTVPNFSETNSPLTQFQTGTFGPIDT